MSTGGPSGPITWIPTVGRNWSGMSRARTTGYHHPPPQADEYWGNCLNKVVPPTVNERVFHPTSAVSATRQTRFPARTSVPEAQRPATPPPTTTTSNCSDMDRLLIPEVEQSSGIQLDDLVHLVVGYIGHEFRDHLPAVRPVRVGVRVVTLPRDLADADVVSQLDPGQVRDEAAPDVLPEQLRRSGDLVDVLIETMPLPGVVGPLEDVGDPARPPFRQGDAQRRVPVEQRGEEHVDRRHHRVAAHERDE